MCEMISNRLLLHPQNSILIAYRGINVPKVGYNSTKDVFNYYLALTEHEAFLYVYAKF